MEGWAAFFLCLSSMSCRGVTGTGVFGLRSGGKGPPPRAGVIMRLVIGVGRRKVESGSNLHTTGITFLNSILKCYKIYKYKSFSRKIRYQNFNHLSSNSLAFLKDSVSIISSRTSFFSFLMSLSFTMYFWKL